MQVVSRYFEEIAIGESRVSSGRTITETDIVLHAGQSGDFYPHHMDDEFAKTTSFGRRIAHGTLTFAIGIGIGGGDINPLAFSYGYDRVRFPAPVFPGDTLHTTVTVTRLLDDHRPAYGRVIETCVVKNQRDEVVLACEHILLVTRREVVAT